jgi:hypothetical protein
MRSSNRTVVIALAGLLVAAAASESLAQQPVVVTVQELIQRDHRIEVPAGTEVVWGDPHFDVSGLRGGRGRRRSSVRRRDSAPCSRNPVPTGAPSRSRADIGATTSTR